MRVAFVFIFLFTSSLSLADCSPSSTCAKNLSLQVMELTESIVPITKEVFRENWYLILEKENLIKQQEFLNEEKSCKRANDLIYAPKGSPLSAYGMSSDEPKYFFTSKVMKMILESQNPKAGLSLGIKSIYDKHLEWLKSIPKEELKKRKEEYRSEYLKNCHEDKSEIILNTYNDILSDHHELEKLQDIFREMKQECQNIFPEYVSDYETGARYSKNEYASKFDTLKNIAQMGCYPMDLVDSLFREEETECNQYLEDIYEIVNPECANKYGADLGFLCNGLHDYLAKTFIENPIYDEFLERFFSMLDKEKGKKRTVDLEKIALLATNNDAVAAWRIMALLGHDELNTTMKMIREELIKSGQYERFLKARHLYTGESSNRGEETFVFDGKVIKLAPKFQNMKKFADLIKTNGRFNGDKIEGRYYHYIAGGLVACELKARGHSDFRANLAATGTGVAYEAYDFESHTHVVENSKVAHLGKEDRLANKYDKKEEENSYWNRLKNTPWKDSFKNFYDDSSLHKSGGELGAKMCQKTTSKR